MRALIVTGLLLASMGATARDMFVVIHTRDAQVVEYRCARVEGNSAVRETTVRRVVRSHGSATWRAVGGVPPYTMIENTSDHPGSVSVTVMDAAGNVATGHGIIGTSYTQELVNCSSPEVPCEMDSLTAYTRSGFKKEECVVGGQRTTGHNPAPPRDPFDPTRTLGSTSSRDHGTLDRTRTLKPTTSRDRGTVERRPSQEPRTTEPAPAGARHRSTSQSR